MRSHSSPSLEQCVRALRVVRKAVKILPGEENLASAVAWCTPHGASDSVDKEKE